MGPLLERILGPTARRLSGSIRTAPEKSHDSTQRSPLRPRALVVLIRVNSCPFVVQFLVVANMVRGFPKWAEKNPQII